MNSSVSGTAGGMSPELYQAAREAAQRAGMSVEDWLRSTFGDSAMATMRPQTAGPLGARLGELSQRFGHGAEVEASPMSARGARDMAEAVDAGAQQVLRVLERRDVRHDADAVRVRLVDDRAIEVRLQLLHRAAAIVDPDLDHVRTAGGEFTHVAVRIVLGGDAVRRVAHRHAGP